MFVCHTWRNFPGWPIFWCLHHLAILRDYCAGFGAIVLFCSSKHFYAVNLFRFHVLECFFAQILNELHSRSVTKTLDYCRYHWHMRSLQIFVAWHCKFQIWTKMNALCAHCRFLQTCKRLGTNLLCSLRRRQRSEQLRGPLPLGEKWSGRGPQSSKALPSVQK